MFSVATYLRLPFVPRGRNRLTGVDCWGLYRLIIGEQLGIWLPDYPDAGSPVAVARDLRAARAGDGWVPVEASAEQRYDLVLMSGVLGCGRSAASVPLHVGCVIEPGLMLDTEEDNGVMLRRYRDTPAGRCHATLANRLLGIYRCREIIAA